jgi:hypothetical protein
MNQEPIPSAPGAGPLKSKTHVFVTVFTAVLFALTLIVTACGGEATTTTVQATTSSTRAVTTTSAVAPATTTSGAATTDTTAATDSVTLPSLQITPELQAYIEKMQVFAASLQVLPAADDPLSVTDASEVTAAQVTAGEAFATMAHGALDQLKAIQPPAEVAAFHENLIVVLLAEVNATDKAAQALRNKDQAMLDAAKAESGQLEMQWSGLMDSLQSLLSGG